MLASFHNHCIVFSHIHFSLEFVWFLCSHFILSILSVSIACRFQDWDRGRKVEATHHKERKLPHHPKPTLRDSIPLKHSFGHYKWLDNNGIKQGKKTAPHQLWHERWTIYFGCIIPHLLTLIKEEILNTKAMIPWRHNTIGETLTNY